MNIWRWLCFWAGMLLTPTMSYHWALSSLVGGLLAMAVILSEKVGRQRAEVTSDC